jgi:hypothetical protein
MVVSTSTTASTTSTGVNQIMEVFKIQTIMKFIDVGSSGHKSLLTILFLLGYDQLVKYIPAMLQFLMTWFEQTIYTKQENVDYNDNDIGNGTGTLETVKELMKSYIK